MNVAVDENDAMRALMGLVQQTDAETIKRVNNYTDPAERRKALSGEFEDNSTVNRGDLKHYMMEQKDLNADRHASPAEMAQAAAIARNAGGFNPGSFAGFIPENEFQGQMPMQAPYQNAIPYAPPQYPTQTQPVVQNLQMPAPATKAIVDTLASIANNLPPALRGLYMKQEEILKEVKRGNDLFVAFLKAYAATASAAKANEEKKDSVAGETVSEEKKN